VRNLTDDAVARVRELRYGRLIDTSETRGSITNLGSNPGLHNAATYDMYPRGSGFSGVYDVESNRFLVYPSGETRLRNGDVPDNLVSQYGGHDNVNNALNELLGSTSNNRLGFSMIIDDSGSFRVLWNSRTINSPNPNFDGRTVPEGNRQQIIDAIEEATGRNAYSGI
jgi:hypothetical protein